MAAFAPRSLFSSSVDPSAGHAELERTLDGTIAAAPTEGGGAFDAEAFAKACQMAKLASINFVPAPPALPLLVKAAARDAAAAVHILVAAKADLNVADVTGTTPCFAAAKEEAHAALLVLIAAGADIHRARTSGATPLYIAAQQGAQRCLASLIEAKADVNAPKEGGFTPACVACMRGRGKSLDTCVGRKHSQPSPRVLSFGSSVHAPPALLLGVRYSTPPRRPRPRARRLLAARADPDVAFSVADRFTPLMLAAHFGQLELLEALVRAGAQLTRRDAQGR